jgi:hypothetical protein
MKTFPDGIFLWKHVDLLIDKIDNVLLFKDQLYMDEQFLDAPVSKYETHWAYFLDSLNLLNETISVCPVEENTDCEGEQYRTFRGRPVDQCELDINLAKESSLSILNDVFKANFEANEVFGICALYLVSKSRSRSDVYVAVEGFHAVKATLIDIRDRLEMLSVPKILLRMEGLKEIENTIEHYKATQSQRREEFYNSVNADVEMMTTNSNNSPSLIVNQNPPQVTLNGNTVNVSPEAARLVQIAIDQQGEYFTPAKYEINKADRIKGSMPLVIQELFESSPGKGTRISHQTLNKLGCIKQ